MSPREADAELAQVLEGLRRREPIFHRPELATTRADFDRMTAPDFVGRALQRRLRPR